MFLILLKEHTQLSLILVILQKMLYSMNNQVNYKLYIFTILKSLFWLLFTYAFMVIISHFSVYHTKTNYKFSDSLNAMFFKSDVPAEFFIYFGLILLIVLLLFLAINFFVGEKSNKNI